MIKDEARDVRPMTGNLNKFYRGVVEDNNDPLKKGRVRVRIWGIHTPNKTKSVKDGIPSEELPWAEPCLPVMEGGISGFGMFGVPVKGSHVMLFFENGHIMQPRYFASMPGFPTEAANASEGFNDPDGVYPTSHRLNQPDWHRLARGLPGATLVETKNSMRDAIEPPSPYAAEYPHNFVFATHGGVVIELDSTPGEERLHLYHPSNSYIEIDKNGKTVVRSQSDKVEVVLGEKRIHIKKDDFKQVDADKETQVQGDLTYTASTINLN
jgi:hypothetical protein